MAVGRPEGRGRVFGAGKHGGLLGIERAEPEVGVAFVVDGGEGEGFAVGRDDHRACVEAGGAECGSRRRRDVGANGKCGSVRRAARNRKGLRRRQAEAAAAANSARGRNVRGDCVCVAAGAGGLLRDAFQLQADVVSGLETVFAIFGEAGGDEIVEGWGRGRFGGADGVGVFFQNGGGDADLAFAFEGALAHGHFVEDCAEGENVGAGVGLFAFDLFGRHVLDSADDAAGGGERADGSGAGHGAGGG